VKTSASSPTLLLGLATAPLLAGILVARSLGEVITELGRTSEEMFRGDRLPILKVRESQERE
jgi:hypothetical protein